ncbi:hypothetical protein [Mesomycoplasma flocculare]|uniref:Uncharacterized protein n=2 Tax=Mesomycoplasma flocculare TaxID=2128 RepID=A0A0A8E7P8_MESFC|nr:hypothetical protein [Mesomycoplasma flocculare]MXR39231.1 hypothetical protein [Mycoplasma sp. MF12]AJC49602.1 hypothetical protein MYF_00100 [Mesomycoplasma flocculare ATCC 27399]MXR05644.1 hypothetical protein [Mesomycoplasma flocculare]MXR23071.1 hypothetical protein [Mesomycoplasma flocculare]MXR56580.1 hypothetical protein [Mesomycoplasma flocculare]
MNNEINRKNFVIYYKSTTFFSYILFRWIVTSIVIFLIVYGITIWDSYTDHLPVPPWIPLFLFLCILVWPLFIQSLLNSFFFFGSAKIIEKALKYRWFLQLTRLLTRKAFLNVKLDKPLQN